MEKISNKPFILFLLTISGLIAVAGVLIMTDVGQLFKIEKSIIVDYFQYNVIYMVISFVLLLFAIYLNMKGEILKKSWIISFSILWVIAILSTKYITPYVLFRTTQHNAEFVSIQDAKDYLADDEIVFAVDLNGVQKAYPRENIWQTHIVGGDFGEDNVLFTYCVLTNLPSPYVNDKENPMDMRVLAQANNNLLIWDTNSGEIIQQINSKCEFSGNELDPLPVLEMTWAGYKKLYPNGTVFYNKFDSPIEIILDKLMATDDSWYGDDWMFKTANFDDTRLHSKEQIIGLRDGDKELAITKTFIKKEKIYNTSVGNKNVVLAYFPEYETIIAFNREVNGTVIDVEEIDAQGNTPEFGKLERVFFHNSPLWAVWAHYYPNTSLIK